MVIKVNVKYGEASYQFEIDEKEEKEALNKAITFGNPPRFCTLCKNDEEFKFTTNKDKEGNIYINAKCGSCGARAKLGEYKTRGYFWHEFSRYEPPKKTETPEPTKKLDQEFPDRDSDIPF